jgi:Fe-S cluster assembly iron-binding protein IscA
MLTISTPAAARMAQLLSAKAENKVMRIIRRDDRLRMQVSLLRPGDQTFVHDGRVVLALDQLLNKTLSRRELDLRQTHAGPRLRLKAP